MNRQFPESLPIETIFGRRPRLQEAVSMVAREVAKLPAVSVDAPSPHALLYGGGVRDVLLGERLRDADVQVYGVDPTILEQVLHSLFPGQVERVGKEYERIEVTISRADALDVSVPRTKTAGISRFEEGDPLLYPLVAARYRDFTINSMSLDPLTGIIYDPFDGRSDLSARQLRLVDEETFCMRGAHVLRGCQFVARLGLSVEEKTAQVMHRLGTGSAMELVPLNVVREELRKLLGAGKKPSQGLLLLHRFGLLRRYFPPQIHNQSPAASASWLATMDRCIYLGRTSRLFPDHIMIAQLALFLAPLRYLTPDDARIEAVRQCLEPLCFSGFQQAAVAEILGMWHRALDLIAKAPQRRPGRARPSRAAERDESANHELVALLGEPLFAPWQSVALVLAVAGGRGIEEMLALCERARDYQSRSAPGRPPSILRGSDVDRILGEDPDPELRQAILEELTHHRYEIITPSRARDFVLAYALRPESYSQVT